MLVCTVRVVFCCLCFWLLFFFFLRIRRPPRSTLDRSSAASDVYKRQVSGIGEGQMQCHAAPALLLVFG